jgi:hypothetical protein
VVVSLEVTLSQNRNVPTAAAGIVTLCATEPVELLALPRTA